MTARREWAIALGVAAALVAVLTYPTLFGFGSLGRLGTGDGQFSIWNIGWIGHALITNPANLYNANIFHPHQGTLAYSELNLVAGLLGLPAYAVSHNAIAALKTASGKTFDLGGFGGATSLVTEEEKELYKIDWNITRDHRLSVRYNETIGTLPQFGRSNGIGGTFTGIVGAAGPAATRGTAIRCGSRPTAAPAR